ncbi:hypothetical protein BZA05DRAFT_125565 [Tricharina praecox]|uniref:uncharacterized protein n=1 Tax=Tricharina praecox TaxID=43433 RepID=UPI00222084CB|nr:uncharacterized protein BZA05DRAFT_125565 [Tricharina praecox]KAI5847543.1 hypothetical protein BZA05DRAFT_125565 [Tricharina praecox]
MWELICLSFLFFFDLSKIGTCFPCFSSDCKFSLTQVFFSLFFSLYLFFFTFRWFVSVRSLFLGEEGGGNQLTGGLRRSTEAYGGGLLSSFSSFLVQFSLVAYSSTVCMVLVIVCLYGDMPGTLLRNEGISSGQMGVK